MSWIACTELATKLRKESPTIFQRILWRAACLFGRHQFVVAKRGDGSSTVRCERCALNEIAHRSYYGW